VSVKVECFVVLLEY